MELFGYDTGIELEWDWTAAIITGIGSAIFIWGIWNIAAWQESTFFDFKNKLIMSFMLPIFIYVMLKMTALKGN